MKNLKTTEVRGVGRRWPDSAQRDLGLLIPHVRHSKFELLFIFVDIFSYQYITQRGLGLLTLQGSHWR